ncbi:MAG: bacteriohemerythrin [Kofleriaceae bacterium]
MEDIAEHAQRVAEVLARLAGHTSADWDLLRRFRATTVPWADQFGGAYAAVLYGHPETLEMVQHRSRSERAKSFAAWYERIVSGAPGSAFWSEAYLVGFMHASASVDNGQVAAASTSLQNLFLTKVVEALGPRDGLPVFQAYKRITDVATGVMIDAYEHAVLVGMMQIGMNEKLIARMRKVAIQKMIDTGRESLPLLDWNDSLSVGIITIDEQHQTLIAILNRLHKSKTAKKGSAELKDILRELVSYTQHHFAFEEKLLAQYDYPQHQAHKASHEKLTEQVLGFASAFDNGSATLSAELFMFLRSWLNGHIRGSDRHYAAHLHAMGVR